MREEGAALPTPAAGRGVGVRWVGWGGLGDEVQCSTDRPFFFFAAETFRSQISSLLEHAEMFNSWGGRGQLCAEQTHSSTPNSST